MRILLCYDPDTGLNKVIVNRRKFLESVGKAVCDADNFIYMETFDLYEEAVSNYEAYELNYLGKLISYLGEADFIIFDSDWLNSRICTSIMYVANEYEIEHVDMSTSKVSCNSDGSVSVYLINDQYYINDEKGFRKIV